MPNPTLVQYAGFASGTNSAGSTQRKCPLPNVVLNNNSVVVCFTCGDSETPTITDDKSNTYTVRQNTDDAGHSQRIFIASSHGITNGPSTIIINGTTFANSAGAGGIAVEYAFLDTSGSPTDGSNGASGTSASPLPGSYSTAIDGDLIITCSSRDDAGARIVSWTAPSGTMVMADLETPLSMQYQIQATHGAINPAITLDASYGWVCASAAFKAGASGTLPSASPRIIGVLHQATNTVGAASASYDYQLPCSHGGDMLYGAFIGVGGDSLSSITDTQSNIWTATGAELNNGGAGRLRAFYVKAPSIAATLRATLNVGGPGTAPGGTFMFYECKGMDQGSPFAAHATNTGTAVGTSFAGASVTPTKANGLVFSTAAIANNTVISCSPGTFISSTDPPTEVSPWLNDENNGWAYKINPDLSAVQVTWTNDIAAGDWCAIADAFSAASGVVPKLMMMGIG